LFGDARLAARCCRILAAFLHVNDRSLRQFDAEHEGDVQTCWPIKRMKRSVTGSQKRSDTAPAGKYFFRGCESCKALPPNAARFQ
jgi:hypothetical protein